MRVLLAPDKFKGSASAAQVADALARGMSRVRPDAQIDAHPIADGGEGTVEVLLQHGFRPVSATVRGPLGGSVTATYAVRQEHAVIESASAYGLGLIPDGPTSMTARHCSSFGVGELVLHAMAGGARTITVAVGGSAGTDGGAGALQALGAQVLDRAGAELPPGGAALARVGVAYLTAAREVLSGIDLEVACDVENPLLGPTGAAAVYAAQKGATPADVSHLQEALTCWSGAVFASTRRKLDEVPGAGAAGGLAFGLAAVGARIVSGLDMMMDLTGLAARLDEADVVIVAEGSLDEQSLQGKGPIGISRAASRSGVPVIAVAGRCTLTYLQQRSAGLHEVHTLDDLEPDPVISMRDAELLLERVGASLLPASAGESLDGVQS